VGEGAVGVGEEARNLIQAGLGHRIAVRATTAKIPQ
jgi:hypothetical protein